MVIWIDIENPPQVQYLLPFRRAFAEAGADVLVTARDYGITYDLLEAAGGGFHPVGAAYGRKKRQKALGLVRRTRELARLFRGRERPGALVCAGRASTLVARRLGIPAFVLVDYEFVDLRVSRLSRPYLAFPDVIDPAAFTSRGMRAEQLLPYRGVKEDLTFAGLDLDAVEPHRFEGIPDGLVRVLFRPPAEESHYHRSESAILAQDLLGRLAGDERVAVVFSPRYAWQGRSLEEHDWANPPTLLEEAIPFVSLLKAVDLVVSAGGTMLREAAYLGVPAYSIFRGDPGGVDRYLESLGRLQFVRSPGDLDGDGLVKRERAPVLASNPGLIGELVDLILSRARTS
jgi:uncharacterized protein